MRRFLHQMLNCFQQCSWNYSVDVLWAAENFVLIDFLYVTFGPWCSAAHELGILQYACVSSHQGLPWKPGFHFHYHLIDKSSGIMFVYFCSLVNDHFLSNYTLMHTVVIKIEKLASESFLQAVSWNCSCWWKSQSLILY